MDQAEIELRLLLKPRLLWFYECELSFKPGTTGGNLLSIRLFMNATFPARFPFEMFDNISDVGLFSINARFVERIVNKRPAGPTKGLPVKSSSLPGCSPTNINRARVRPSPKTVCVPFFQRSHARQSAAASLSSGNDSWSGTRSAAELARLRDGISFK